VTVFKKPYKVKSRDQNEPAQSAMIYKKQYNVASRRDPAHPRGARERKRTVKTVGDGVEPDDDGREV